MESGRCWNASLTCSSIQPGTNPGSSASTNGARTPFRCDFEESDMKLLDGKTCVITGGGSGVGRAAAVLFAEHGASVVVGDVRDEWAKDTVQLVEQGGGRAVAVHCDVSQERDVEEVVAIAVSHFGRLDVMYNNAGVSSPKTGLSFVDHTQDDWDRLLGINLMGMVYGCKHAVLQFRRHGGGARRGRHVLGLPE